MSRPPPRNRNNTNKDSGLWTVGRPRSPPLFPVVANSVTHVEVSNDNNDEAKGDEEDNNDDNDFEKDHDEEHDEEYVDKTGDKDSDSEYVEEENNDDNHSSDDDGQKVADKDGSNRLKVLSELMDLDLLEDQCEPQSYRCDRVMGLNAGRKSNRELPPIPNYAGMSEREKEDAKKDRQKLIKKEYDRARKSSRSVAPMRDDIVYSGDISEKLRPMTHVRLHPLEEGHTFPRNKIALQLRIVEEANLFGVRIAFKRSDNCQVLANGNNMDPFVVSAAYVSKTQSWVVGTCITRSGRHIYVPPKKKQRETNRKQKDPLPPVSVHDLLPPEENEIVAGAFDNDQIVGEEGDPDELLKGGPELDLENDLDHLDEREGLGDYPDNISMPSRQKSPFSAWMFEPIIFDAVSKTPNLSSKTIRGMLQDYANDLFITDNLIQNTRTNIRNKVFGHPDENILYLPALAMSLEECGHSFHVVKKTPFQVKKRLLNIILQEKINALANRTPPKQMNTVQKLEYVDAWQVANAEMLNDVGLGQNCVEGGEETFVTGLFLSTAAAKNSVPLLQTVYQADAAHMNFGKYTLYSCYGITANCNALPVAFGIVFGNEDREGWGLFWKFAKTLHPTIDQRTVTIITDQQKGSIEAMKEVVPLAVNFFCSYHRKKNIAIHVKGGKGEFSCHWYYELLVGQSSMGALELKKAECECNMQANALKYLANVNEYQQYPAARVEYGRTRGVDVYMYTRSSSSTAEAMNAANFAVRARTAVDPVNAIILLLKLEVERYNKQLQNAWSHTSILTPHGHALSLKIFEKVNQRDYMIKIEDDGPDKYLCIVQRYTSVNKNQCWFPKSYDENGSLFGGCSCGYPFTSGLPCHHMIAVVQSNRIAGLNEMNVMPIWWHTSHWRKQLPRASAMRFNIDLTDLRTKCTQQTNYSLCPPYTAPKTTGRPREEKRMKSSVEKAIENKNNKAEVSNLKRKPVLPMLDDTLYKDKPPKKRRSNKQGKDENQCKHQASKGNDDDDDNIVLSDLGKTKKNSPNVTPMIYSSTIDKYNEDLKNNTIGKRNTRGKKKIVKRVAGVVGDDADQSQQITRRSARRAGK